MGRRPWHLAPLNSYTQSKGIGRFIGSWSYAPLSTSTKIRVSRIMEQDPHL